MLTNHHFHNFQCNQPFEKSRFIELYKKVQAEKWFESEDYEKAYNLENIKVLHLFGRKNVEVILIQIFIHTLQQQ